MIILVCLWGNGNIGTNHSPSQKSSSSSSSSTNANIVAPDPPKEDPTTVIDAPPEMKHLQLNFMQSLPDHRDHQLLLNLPKLPTTVDLSTSSSSIKNQGNFGACTAFAGVAAMEYIYKKFDPAAVKVEDKFSERFTYYTTREAMGVAPNNDSGAYIRDVVKVLVKKGTCLEGTCPYLPYSSATLTQKPSAQAYQEATTYQVLSYANIPEDKNKMTSVKSVLASGYPIICGFTCYQNVFSGKGGNIPLPKGNIIGGHAILIEGYDENKQMFKFKNSWSPSWGDKGYGYLPYNYLNTGNMSDLWVIYTQEDKNIAIGVTKPTVNINAIKSNILTFVAASDLKSFAKIQSDVETTIINVTPNLTVAQVTFLKAFTAKIITALQLIG